MPVPSRKLLFAAPVAGVILALGLTGCGVISQIADAAQGKKDVFSMQVGDCTDDEDLEATEVTSVRDASCDDAHDNEVYMTWELESDQFPGGAYPGDEAMIETADGGCVTYFETWVGTPVDETSLYFFPYYPSAQSWANGDREVVCLAYDTNGPVTGSLEGKGSEYPY